jgi:hypothetical protein
MAVEKSHLIELNKDLAGLFESLSFDEFYRTIESQLLDYADRLSTAGSKPNLRELIAEIERFVDPESAKYLVRVLSGYNDVIDSLNQRYEFLGQDVNRDFSELRRIDEVTRKRFGKFSSDTNERIARVLRQDLKKGKSYKEITRNLRPLDKKVSGYAETIAITSTKGYSRAGKSEKARLGEVFYYEYVGIIRASTRGFCRSLVGTTHHIDQINQMRNGQLNPVLTYCGGYRCFHDWEPDPFAEKGSSGSWQTVEIGKRKIKVYTEDDIQQYYEEQ